MDSPRYSCIKLFAIALPLLCLLSRSCPAASSTSPPPPSSALLAADALRTRGYSLFASLVESMSATANFSGTLLAPPDFAFSSTAAKFLSSSRPPPRPSISLLLYHTIRPPLALTLPALSSRPDGDEFHTLYSNNCLFLSRSPYGGEISISLSPYRNPMTAVKIRQPDLYADEHLVVHGIDGVLDPSLAVKCTDPMASDAVAVRVNRTFLDRAMRALRRTGYNVVASAMAIRSSELLPLTSVTVLAVSDENLFLKPGGFRFNFRHHVVPARHRFRDLADLTEVDTLAPNVTVHVRSVDGAVSVDGVAVDETEVYRNKWIVVVSVMESLDDVVFGSQPKAPISAPFPGDFGIRIPSAARDEANETHCDLSNVVSIGVEGGDLLCPVSPVRQLLEMDDDVEESKPSDANSQLRDDSADQSHVVKISENVNIADDVFFYI